VNKPPTLFRSLALAAVAIVGTRWLVHISPAAVRPASVDPDSIVAWWDTVGTPAAAMAMVRMVGIATGAYVSAVALIAVILSSTGLLGRSSGVTSLWNIVSTDGMRRLLAIGTIALWTANPVMASAAVDTSPPIVLSDLGPVSISTPTTIEPVTANPEETPPITIEIPIDGADASGRTWTVAPGDHLWRIAELTLERDGQTPPPATTANYWRRLIDENRSTIGLDPNLIFPGQVLILPSP